MLKYKKSLWLFYNFYMSDLNKVERVWWSLIDSKERSSGITNKILEKYKDLLTDVELKKQFTESMNYEFVNNRIFEFSVWFNRSRVNKLKINYRKSR